MQLWFIGPFQLKSTGPGTYFLDPPLRIAAVYPWFHISLFKPTWPQSTGQPMLKDDSSEAEAILQINKRVTHAKYKWMGFESSCSQWIKLPKLRK